MYLHDHNSSFVVAKVTGAGTFLLLLLLILFPLWFTEERPPVEARRGFQVQRRDHNRPTEAASNGDLCPACIHEASHTVAALVMGNRIQFTRLTSDGSGVT